MPIKAVIPRTELSVAGRAAAADRAENRDPASIGVLGYTQLAPLLAEHVTRLEAAVLAEEFASRTLNESLVTEFHARIRGGLTSKWAGKWREMEVTVGPLTPPAQHPPQDGELPRLRSQGAASVFPLA